MKKCNNQYLQIVYLPKIKKGSKTNTGFNYC